MATGNIFSYSDLYQIHNIVQSTSSSVIKQLLIAQLRDLFSKDSFYHYQSDSFGFPKTVELLDTPTDIGLNNSGSTRLYIGEYYKYESIYFPAILVKSGSIKSVPLSINAERETITYDTINIIDGYGNSKLFKTPKAFLFAGFFTGDIQIDILTRESIRTRDDLIDLILLHFARGNVGYYEMEKSGVIISEIGASSPTENDDRNDKLFKQTVTLSIQSQWRREIPISNICEAINICIEFASNLAINPPAIAPNLGISTRVDLLSEIQNIKL